MVGGPVAEAVVGMRAPEGTRLQDFRPQLVCEAWDERLGSLGYVVIDRTLQGAAIGGIRCVPGVSVDEVAALARSMTLKCAFLNLSLGGAKAGISAPPDLLAQRRGEVMLAFGRAIAPLLRQGVYIPGEDMGMAPADLDLVLRGAGMPPARRGIDGAHYAALTAVETIRHAAAAVGLPLAGATLAIEGFGRVGAEIALAATAMGMRLVAFSTVAGAVRRQDSFSPRELVALRRQQGDAFVAQEGLGERIGLAALLTLPVDVMVLCARPWSVWEGNADAVRARLLVCAANAAVSPQAEAMLAAAGRCVLPDLVANGGAVLASDMVARGFTAADVRRVTRDDFGQAVSDVMAAAAATRRPPAEVAREVAWTNLARLSAGGEARDSAMPARLARLAHRGWRGGAERVAGALYDRGWLRTRLTHDLALADLRRAFNERALPGSPPSRRL